ncbi:hypothetical protein CSTAT_04275 [Corynebacterium stationis]|uniref:DUF4231 domain-containing protein n=1 Tax=Corynebacterium stationis TaxID=1705 RepID=UPI000950A6BD|nr:DUF4231 domain-containing protein [Corynebacterium stationis]APT94578.1 hypothetical protein CSTAT_04275 [Corynebacterium stationis]
MKLEFPSLLEATEKASASAQKYFFCATGSSFVLLALASVTAFIPTSGPGEKVGAILCVLFFLIAIVIQISSTLSGQEQKWYQARAASESIKTATWEFSVGGESFRIDDESANVRFRDTLKRILSDLESLDIGPEGPKLSAITESMRNLRKSNLATRAQAYRSERVEDQIQWYSNKAKQNKQQHCRFMKLVVGIESLAVVLGILRIAGWIDVDMLSPIAAIAAGLAGWMQAKKYSNLATAYAVTSHEASLVLETLSLDDVECTEPEWAQLVHDAEAAFSREHTMWLARRQGPV